MNNRMIQGTLVSLSVMLLSGCGSHELEDSKTNTSTTSTTTLVNKDYINTSETEKHTSTLNTEEVIKPTIVNTEVTEPTVIVIPEVIKPTIITIPEVVEPTIIVTTEIVKPTIIAIPEVTEPTVVITEVVEPTIITIPETIEPIVILDIPQITLPNPIDQHFMITVKTDNNATSSNTSFTIPTHPGETYNYSVDCDNDGTN